MHRICCTCSFIIRSASVHCVAALTISSSLLLHSTTPRPTPASQKRDLEDPEHPEPRATCCCLFSSKYILHRLSHILRNNDCRIQNPLDLCILCFEKNGRYYAREKTNARVGQISRGTYLARSNRLLTNHGVGASVPKTKKPASYQPWRRRFGSQKQRNRLRTNHGVGSSVPIA